MAKRVTQYGRCHLCGVHGPLTEEHVPPKKAFNNRRTIILSFNEALALGPETPDRGKIRQGGVRGYTLCAQCNNNTGSWYGRALIDWCYRGMEILERSGGRSTLINIYNCYPLRILKQILIMFCSVNSDKFTDVHPWLRRYLLNRESRGLPPSFRLYLYYNITGKLRYAGLSSQVDTKTGNITLISEITYPPFGYVLTIDSDPPNERLGDISFFDKYSYNELGRLEIMLPTLPTHLLYPGDYRTRSEILAQRSTED